MAKRKRANQPQEARRCPKFINPGMTCIQYERRHPVWPYLVTSGSAAATLTGILFLLARRGAFAVTADYIALGIVAALILGVVTIVGGKAREVSLGKYALIGAGSPWTLFSLLNALLTATSLGPIG